MPFTGMRCAQPLPYYLYCQQALRIKRLVLQSRSLALLIHHYLYEHYKQAMVKALWLADPDLVSQRTCLSRCRLPDAPVHARHRPVLAITLQ